MRRVGGTVWILMMVVFALPAQAIVIEEVVKHHPLVVFVNSLNSAAILSTGESSDSAFGTPLEVTSPAVAPDDMTVEVVPLRLPELPAQVVFSLYLLGALVFYTLLVLIAQPGLPEHS